jgi:hypothetical protein
MGGATIEPGGTMSPPPCKGGGTGGSKLGLLTAHGYPDNLLSVVIRISDYPISDTNMVAVAS